MPGLIGAPIPVLDETWERVASINLASADKVAAVTVDLPDGATMARIVGGALVSDTANRDLWMRINGLNTTIYHPVPEGVTSIPAAAQFPLIGGNVWQSGESESLSFDLTIMKRVAGEPARVEGSAGARAAANGIHRSFSGLINDTSNALGSVTFLMSGTGSFYGQMLVEAFVP